jgi:PPOX class probable F420-dependent enzyme
VLLPKDTIRKRLLAGRTNRPIQGDAGESAGKNRVCAQPRAWNVEINPAPLGYNILMPIPPEIQGHKYISLTTFRKTDQAVPTPVWFGEADGKLYVMSRSDSGKSKRIRNNPQVRVAPCTMRGKITGPEFAAAARLLPSEGFPRARNTLRRKYWLMRISFLWSKENIYFEIEVGSTP